MGTVAVLQNVDIEPPARIATVMKGQGHSVRVHRVDRGALPPSPAGADALVVMGGPMAVYQSDRYGWLADELDFLRRALTAGVPTLGVCLGSQILAAAAGGRVYPGAAGPELGWSPVQLTPEGRRDPLLGALRGNEAGSATGALPVFQWHGDTFDLPQGAVRLASSERYPNQAFRLGSNAYGVQFHVEVTAPVIDMWLGRWGHELAATRQTPQGVRLDTGRNLPALERRGNALLQAFARLIPAGSAAAA